MSLVTLEVELKIYVYNEKQFILRANAVKIVYKTLTSTEKMAFIF